MTEIYDAIKSFGAIGLFAILAMWLKPWAEKMFTAHLSLVKTLSDTQQRHEDSLKKLSETTEKLATNQAMQTSTLNKVADTLVEVKDAAVTSNEILKKMPGVEKNNSRPEGRT